MPKTMQLCMSSCLFGLLFLISIHLPSAAAVREEHEPHEKPRELQKDPNLVKGPIAIAKTSKAPTIKATKAPTNKAIKAPTATAVKTTKAPTPPKTTATKAPVGSQPAGQAAPTASAPISVPTSVTAPPSCPLCPSGDGDIVLIVFVPAPTNEPTTPRPTQSPARRPTRAPTFRPTSRPTRSPTNFPTRTPTRSPTPGPTLAPTTAIPTLSPTAFPTHAPVVGPSTPWPTSAPSTLAPIRTPTQEPSLSLQPSTSSLPSTVPTPVYAFDLVILSEQQVQLRLYVSSSGQRRFLQNEATPPPNESTTRVVSHSACESSSTAAWVQKVQDSIHANVARLVPGYETLDVLVYNPTATVAPVTATDQREAIVLQMDILIRIRSSIQIDEQEDKELFMKGPWDTPTERLAFATWLREHASDGRSGCFDHIADTSPLLMSQQQQQTERDGALTRIIAVVATLSALVCCCCAICGIVEYRRRNSAITMPPPKKAESYKNSNENDEAILEIACDEATNEVSTLGDPIGPYHAAPVMGVSTVGSTSLDYDYQVAFGRLMPQAQDEDELTGIGASTTAMSQREDVPVNSLSGLLDPAMLERLSSSELPYRVTAPKGPLGLFLRSHPLDGRPMVVHVKQTSCLAAFVQPSDCLLTVNDDVVVTGYPPSRVSQLLVSLMQQLEEESSSQSRIALVFSRPRT